MQLIKDGQGLRGRSDRRRDPPVPRHADRAGQRQPLPRPIASRKISICSHRMRAGEFPDGAQDLRAKIDMASPNINLRDPILYRIRHATHHRTGDKWCIYPMYDYTHGHVGLDRRNHALDLHAGVRRPPPAVRLGHRSTSNAPAHPAADRIRPAESHLHGDEQAEAPAAGRREIRQRLGRSAHAHDLRAAPAGVHAGGDPNISASASAWRNETASSRWPCSKTSSVRT